MLVVRYGFATNLVPLGAENWIRQKISWGSVQAGCQQAHRNARFGSLALRYVLLKHYVILLDIRKSKNTKL